MFSTTITEDEVVDEDSEGDAAKTKKKKGKKKGGKEVQPKQQDGEPKQQDGDGSKKYQDMLATCINVTNKSLKKASINMGLTTKNKLSKATVQEVQKLTKKGEELRKDLSSAASTSKIDKKKSEGVVEKDWAVPREI